MLCAAIDIGSNTTRVLVAEPVDGQLKKVMEQRAYTRIDKAVDEKGAISAAKDRGGRRVRRHPGAAGARARRGTRSARWRPPRCARRATATRSRAAIAAAAGVAVEILSGEEEGRLAFIGATKPRATRPRADRRRRRRRRLDRGDPRHRHRRRRVGALLADRLRHPRRRADLLRPALGGGDPPRPRPHRGHLRGGRDRAPRPGRRGRRLRHLAAPPGRRGARVRDPGAGHPRPLRRLRPSRSPAASSSTRSRVRILTTGVLLLEKVSELLGQPLQIGKGGLREGVILDLLNGELNG